MTRMGPFSSALVILIPVLITSAWAANNGNCNIQGIEDMHWQSAYVNTALNDNDTLHIIFPATQPISLTSTTSTYITGFIDDDSSLILRTTDAFADYESTEPSSAAEHSLTAAFSFLCTNSDPSELLFRQPITDINQNAPSFSQESYSVELPMPLVANMDVAQFGLDITVTDIDISNTWVDFVIDTEDFSVETEGPIDELNKVFRAVIRTKRAVRYTEDQTFLITATDVGTIPGTLSSSVSLTIKVDAENSYPEAPTFSNAYYTATYHNEEETHSITVNEPIVLTSGYDNAVVTLNGENSENFEVGRTEDAVTINLGTNLPDDLLSQTTLIYTLRATVADSDSYGVSVLIISLPIDDCSLTTTTTNTDCPPCIDTCPPTAATPTDCPTDCPSDTTPECPTTSTDCPIWTECPVTVTVCPDVTTPTEPDDGTTTTVAPEVTVEFTKSLYTFLVDPSFVGIVGSVEASSSVDEAVVYSFSESQNNLLIDEESGTISIDNYLSNGVHYLVIQATGTTSGVVGVTNVAISVDSVSICDDEVKTAYNILVKHIVEEEINEDIVTIEGVAGYKYEIFDQYPPSASVLFEINDDTGSLQSGIVDREWSTLADMFVPQFMLKLRLVESSTDSRRKRSALVNPRFDYEDESKAWTYVDREVQNIANEMVVFVVVDDVNDNAPVFDEIDTVIGYPDKKLAALIMPPYLTVVHATDPDEGYNASVFYTTDNENVYVHPVTGVVYPTEDIYDSDETEFLVVAADRNGTGRSTASNKITVKLLNDEQVSVLTTENQVLEDIDEHLAKLSSEVNLSIKYLTASVIPRASWSRRKRDVSDHYLRIVAYGLDQNDDPVTAEALEKLVGSTSLDWSVESWHSFIDEDIESSNTGLIVAVSILAVLLGAVLIAGILFYFLKLRKLSPYSNMDENRDISPLADELKNIDETGNGKTHGGLFAKNPNAIDSSKLQIETPKRRLTGNVFLTGNRLEETSDAVEEDEVTRVSELGNGVVETEKESSQSPVRERKKSVVFNDTVEKMEIEKEPETPDEEAESDGRV